MKKSIASALVFTLWCAASAGMAQQVTIAGKVRHANTYGEIANVNIYLKGTQTGTTTDINGLFSLKISNIPDNSLVVFSHVSFFPLELPISQAREMSIFNLKPRIIQLPAVSVEAEKIGPQILKDIPQPYSIIDDKAFAARGYMDIGDLLKLEQSVQVEEDLSGKKSISIRGGNADDVVVLFNGIRMNNIYDNIFDISRINLDDIQLLEIIRGSNTSLYGSEAISGVLNIIPKVDRNYTVRFQQKIGTYASGDWNVNVNRTVFGRLNLSYSYRQSGLTRKYPADEFGVEYHLDNLNLYHNANVIYDLSREKERAKNITLSFFRSDLDYANNRSNEELSNFSQMVVSRFNGDIAFVKNISLVGAYQWFDERKELSTTSLFVDRYFDNRTLNVNVEKIVSLKNFDCLLSYQFEHNRLDFKDELIVIENDEIQENLTSALLTRGKHGLAAILKWHVQSESEFFKTSDIDISFRRDFVQDRTEEVDRMVMSELSPLAMEDQDWDQSMLKFSSYLSGNSQDFKGNAYLNFGANYKFPSILQQLSTPSIFRPTKTVQGNLYPEKNKNLELGLEFMREIPLHPNVSGWSISANYFVNNFTNKLRMYYLPYSPIAFYDNVHDATISGVETKLSAFFWDKKFTLEFGSSNYAIPERAAFPFKSEHKTVINLFFDHAGFSVKLNWFSESEQYAWIRSLEGEFTEVELPSHTNIDLHLSKHLELFKIQFIFNFSGRNLLDSDQRLEGIAIRDRRYYLTFGVQY